MAQLKDILELEANRSAIADCRVIHLHQEGKFLRAYEVSAWLFSRFVNEKYKISNKSYKGQKGTVALLGFPPDSLEKLLTQERCAHFGKVRVNDTLTDLHVPSELIPDDYEADLFLEDYARWKRELPKDEPAVDPLTDKPAAPGKTTALGLLQKALAFPVERKSPIECQAFLCDLRTEIASIF